MSFRFIARPALLLAVTATTFAVASAASSATTRPLRGVVVHDNHRAHSFVVALASGRLAAVHSSQLPSVGTTVAVAARTLRNGTYAGNAASVGHRVHSARISGVVTFVDRRRGLFTVSADGASLLVHRSARASAASASTQPVVGEDVSVAVSIDGQGGLEDQSVQATGTQTAGIDLEGTVLAVDATARTLTVSADDEDQSGQSVTVAVPPAIDITAFAANQQVELIVTQQTDGSFLLQASSGDQGSQQANSPGDQQGCQQDDGGDGGQPSQGATTPACTSGGGGSQGSGQGDGGSGGGGGGD